MSKFLTSSISSFFTDSSIELFPDGIDAGRLSELSHPTIPEVSVLPIDLAPHFGESSSAETVTPSVILIDHSTDPPHGESSSAETPTP
ncbi:hypothetical protein RHSIM_Rhsim07G0224000 [Rhododendron simsii]|uniref:Uncharacterized protein n=1 Tax=Rhododendron simsii TaxID=118357 RepID=A0A834GRQ5_RHOSS|nr:hypothetical protein RHSIM_Rhsim07G0224000 [Rhododendron simsii]